MFLDDYIKACHKRPIVNLNKNNLASQNPSVLDLILSKTSAKSETTRRLVVAAFEQLLELKNPLINRMLEITAYSVYFQELFVIYITDIDEALKIKDQEGERSVGNYNPTIGIMVCRGDGELAGTLIHEITHAITQWLFDTDTLSQSRNAKWLSKGFFNKHFPRECSRYISDEIRRSHRDQYAALLSFCLDTPDGLKVLKAFNSVYIPRLIKKAKHKHSFAENIYKSITPYHLLERESEFLSFLLQHFVDKAQSDPDFVFKPFGAKFPELREFQYAAIFQMMCMSMPVLTKVLLRNIFKTEVDQFAKSIYKLFRHNNVEVLEYSGFYETSFPEDGKIHNPSSTACTNAHE